MGTLKLSNSSGNFVALTPPSSIASDVTLTLPNTDGDSGQYLQTNGTGTLSWQTVNPVQVLSVTGRQSATRNVLSFASMSAVRVGSSTISSSDINSASKLWEVSYTPTNSSGSARIDALLNSFCEDTNNTGTYFGVALVAKHSTTWSVVDFELLANDWDGVFAMWLAQGTGSVNDGATHLSLSGKVDVANLNTIAVIGYGEAATGDVALNDIANNTTTYTTQEYTSFIQVTEY